MDDGKAASPSCSSSADDNIVRGEHYNKCNPYTSRFPLLVLQYNTTATTITSAASDAVVVLLLLEMLAFWLTGVVVVGDSKFCNVSQMNKIKFKNSSRLTTIVKIVQTARIKELNLASVDKRQCRSTHDDENDDNDLFK
ncbi:hypothetical protein DFA_03644 [Cavenderia fasciculata]|uniref:Uncharacterized protein n=1 Tax=Cavenderia fasciculata TaxID=261658 RepID=F4PIG6_CACFS|nr:uncharacterized protein DFA_03644 [Cavenderia fasciculata]EGG25395.1 hypothetical protein DFA_03644 [Cavenderia fasciculata]|eukprot:XP_004363246.1 hypothetical protein DFA_03644 [Cavenderia fasciculata]